MPGVSAFLVDVFRLFVWLVIVIFVPLERWFAVRPQRVFRGGFLADLGFFFLNSLLSTTLLALPMAAAAMLARSLLPDWWLPAAAALSLWLRMVLAFVIGDIGFYWGHRWSHERPWMWRFHRVHHTPEELDWLINRNYAAA